MLRWLYIQVLWAHPAPFRWRFGDEMLEAFDLSSPREHLGLLGDGVVSLARQWVLRREFHEPWQAAPANGPVYEPITFRQIEPYKPRRIALAQGGLAALLLLFGVVDVINHGGGKVRSFVVGMRRPGFGILKVDRTAFEGQPLVASQQADDEEDPMRPFLRSYEHVIRALAALDADADLTVTAAEIANAPAVLRALDANHDGKLSAEECGFLPPGGFHGPPAEKDFYRRDFMRHNPVLAALDKDGDGVISADEIANARKSLLALDIDHDGNLSAYELLPHPAVSEAAALINRFDANDSGVISVQSLPKDDPDLDAVKKILLAADRNGDGVVTRGELTLALAGRHGLPAAPPPPSR